MPADPRKPEHCDGNRIRQFRDLGRRLPKPIDCGRLLRCEFLSARYIALSYRLDICRDRRVQFRKSLLFHVLDQLRPSFLRGSSASASKPVTPPEAPSSCSRCACQPDARACFSLLSSKSPSSTSPLSTWPFSSSTNRSRILSV